jgi:hypothetical protein
VIGVAEDPNPDPATTIADKALAEKELDPVERVGVTMAMRWAAEVIPNSETKEASK